MVSTRSQKVQGAAAPAKPPAKRAAVGEKAAPASKAARTAESTRAAAPADKAAGRKAAAAASTPQKAAVAPKEAAVSPKQPTAAPNETAVERKESAAAPKEKTAAPKEKTAAPTEKTTVSKDKASTSNEKVVAPKEKAAAPKEKTAAPKEKTTALKPTAVAPKAESPAKKAAAENKQAAESSVSQELRTRIERAVDALLVHEREKTGGEKKSLLDLEEGDLPPAEEQSARSIWLKVGTVAMAGDSNLKPVRLQIPHPWRSASNGAAYGLRVCLIVKDPQRAYKDAVAPLKLSALVKVAGIGKLRKKFPSFEARRQLIAAHDMFLADRRILSMVPSVLGKEVYARNKHPVAVDIGASVLAEDGALARELTDAIESTSFVPASGTTCVSVRVGVVGQSAAHIAANAAAVVRQLSTKLSGGLANVRSLHIKSVTSVALPVYVRASAAEN